MLCRKVGEFIMTAGDRLISSLKCVDIVGWLIIFLLVQCHDTVQERHLDMVSDQQTPKALWDTFVSVTDE